VAAAGGTPGLPVHCGVQLGASRVGRCGREGEVDTERAPVPEASIVDEPGTPLMQSADTAGLDRAGEPVDIRVRAQHAGGDRVCEGTMYAVERTAAEVHGEPAPLRRDEPVDLRIADEHLGQAGDSSPGPHERGYVAHGAQHVVEMLERIADQRRPDLVPRADDVEHRRRRDPGTAGNPLHGELLASTEDRPCGLENPHPPSSAARLMTAELGVHTKLYYSLNMAMDAHHERLRVADLLRRTGHALVAHETDESTLAALGDGLASALERLEGGPARRLEPADVRRLVFDTPQPPGRRLEHFPDCPGCGRANPHGLAMEVRREGEEILASVVLGSCFAGAPGRAHGGVIALLIDDLMGFALRTPAFTVALTISYLAPVPVQHSLDARCRVTGREGRRIELEATVAVDGAVAAHATATFVTVPAERYDAA
jgi:acyl-coenzyme A thioesterase PaaI-like protein